MILNIWAINQIGLVLFSGAILLFWGSLILSEIFQHSWKWIDDDDTEIRHNFVIQLVATLLGYVDDIHRDVNKWYKIDDLGCGISGSRASSVFIVFIYHLYITMLLGIILAILYYPIVVGSVAFTIALAVLTRYARRISKRLDVHLLNHK